MIAPMQREVFVKVYKITYGFELKFHHHAIEGGDQGHTFVDSLLLGYSR